MRIAFAAYGSLERVSGGNVYDRALLGALAALGHEVEVVSVPWSGYVRAVASNLKPWAMEWERRRQATTDVIIEDELVHPSLFLRGRRQSWTGRRRTSAPAEGPARVALVHNLRSKQPRERLAPMKSQVERRYLASLGGVIAVCESTLEDVREMAGRGAPALVAHAGRDHVSPDVDDTYVDQRAREPGALRILHVATLAPHKGLARLLGALARHARFDFRLDVVGSGEANQTYAREVGAVIRALGLGARVRLHGERRGAELCALYRRNHVLVVPSDREAYSLAGLEALGFGLPVLATARGGMGEMLRDSGCGALLDPEDGAAWARKLEGLAVDRGYLGGCARAARRRYLEHPTWHEVALRVQDFLERIIVTGQGRAASPG